MTASMVNPCTAASEKLRCDTLDMFLDLIESLREKLYIKRQANCRGQHKVVIIFGTHSAQHVLLSALSAQEAEITMWKADIASAFRRVPIRPEHRQHAYVCIATENGPLVAGHNATPFGAVASVHAWDRIGDFVFGSMLQCAFPDMLSAGCVLTAIARRILKIPIMRQASGHGLQSRFCSTCPSLDLQGMSTISSVRTSTQMRNNPWKSLRD